MIVCTHQSSTPLIEVQLQKLCLYRKKIMNYIHTIAAFSFSSESASHCNMMVSKKKYRNAYVKWMSFKSPELDTLRGLIWLIINFMNRKRVILLCY